MGVNVWVNQKQTNLKSKAIREILIDLESVISLTLEYNSIYFKLKDGDRFVFEYDSFKEARHALKQIRKQWVKDKNILKITPIDKESNV